MKRALFFFFAVSVSFSPFVRAKAQGFASGQKGGVISLAGIWKFKLDPFFTGINSNGVQMMPALPEEITLPGSTDEAGKGYKTQGMGSLRLTRMYEYKGAAWYEKEVFVPAEWKDKKVELFLERAHWETSVWVNDRSVGKRESLSAPHVYNISSQLRPGERNVIRIRVDNSMIYNIEYSHAMSAETQTGWNGIIGRIELRAVDKVNLHEIQVYPQPGTDHVKVKIVIENLQKKKLSGTLTFRFGRKNITSQAQSQSNAVGFSGSDSLIEVGCDMPMGSQVQRWDEFSPTLYRMGVQLHAGAGGLNYEDSGNVVFGVRELAVDGTRFTINGHALFVRGTVNSAEFPLTGYPYMDTAHWMHIFRTCKAYGLNAMRFHSWCPPEAAFEAADQLGMYLQVENSDWRFTIGKDTAVNRFLKEESEKILRTYGNHPSFAMFCEGNELVGPGVQQFLSELVTSWKVTDPRHLYTGASGYPVVPENQYNDFYGARPQHWKEGLKGRFNVAALNTDYDYSDYVRKFKIPMITHEIGQWCVYPSFDQLSKYSGVLKPYNYELFRELLRDHHLDDRAAAFTEASGKFQVIQKKEEIESYLRTPGMGGYHLLQLNDFPGQGTAPVGVVDIFWDPKPYTSSTEFSRFQSARVPLIRTAGFTWTNDDVFSAAVQFANFGDAPIENADIEWTMQYANGQVYAKGSFEGKTIPVGSPITIDSLSVPLKDVQGAAQLLLTISVKGTNISNDWRLWVYPQALPAVDMRNVIIARKWNDKVKDQLKKGNRVLLLPDTTAIVNGADPVFSGISWNTVWSGMPPNLLGVLCDTSHPALQFFPTSFHSDWQWWDIVRHSKPFVLEHTPPAFRPVVQMIPDWNNPRKIALVMEAKVGKGTLLVSSVDLINNMEQRPVARQFLYSLEKYISSDAFSPQQELTMEMVDRLFK